MVKCDDPHSKIELGIDLRKDNRSACIEGNGGHYNSKKFIVGDKIDIQANPQHVP